MEDTEVRLSKILPWKAWLKIMAVPSIVIVLCGILDLFGCWSASRVIFTAVPLAMPVFVLTAILEIRDEKATKITLLQGLATLFGGLLLAILGLCFFTIASVKIGQLAIATEERPISTKVVDGWLDIRGEIHTHSCLSHDSKVSLEDVAKAAKSAGVRWLILTDHIDELPSGNYPKEIDGVLFIYGGERNWKKQGSHLQAPIDSPRRLHAYCHIEEFKEWDDEQWDALELVNFHANAFNVNASFNHRVGTLKEILFYLLFDPKKAYRALARVLPGNLTRWQELAEREGHPMPIFAAPDAHQNTRFLGVQLDPYRLWLSLVSTHIWLESGKELNQESIFRAIKRGRTYIAFDYLGDTTGFQFWAEEAGDRHKVFTGDTVEKPAALTVRLPSGVNCVIRTFRGNCLVTEKKVSAAETLYYFEENPRPGFWRVEIERDGFPWIVSGQILVK